MLHSQRSRQDIVSEQCEYRPSCTRFSVRNVVEFVDKEGGMIVDKSLEERQDSCALVSILCPSREHQFAPHPHSEKRNCLLDLSCVAIKVDEILVVVFGVWNRGLRPCLAVQPNMHRDPSSSLERLTTVLAKKACE